MNLFGALDVSASALQAQRIRADVVAVNMANAETTRTSGPYQREHVVFEAQDGGSFQEWLLGQGGLGMAGSGPGGLGQFAPGGRLRNASFLSAMPGSVSASGRCREGLR